MQQTICFTHSNSVTYDNVVPISNQSNLPRLTRVSFFMKYDYCGLKEENNVNKFTTFLPHCTAHHWHSNSDQACVHTSRLYQPVWHHLPAGDARKHKYGPQEIHNSPQTQNLTICLVLLLLTAWYVCMYVHKPKPNETLKLTLTPFSNLTLSLTITGAALQKVVLWNSHAQRADTGLICM